MKSLDISTNLDIIKLRKLYVNIGGNIMRKRLLIILTLCIGLIFVGCGSDKTENDANSNGNTTGTVTDENKDDSTTEKPSTDTSTSPEDQEDAKDKEVSLPIYTADVNTLELTKLGSLKVNESDSLKSKLDKLAIELSKNAFDSLSLSTAFLSRPRLILNLK